MIKEKTQEMLEKESKEIMKEDTNDYKELFGKLRNVINESRDNYRVQLSQVKDSIEVKKEELKILEIKQRKLEGAVEVSDAYLTSVLPSNNKK